MSQPYIPLRITGIRSETHDVKSFILETAESPPLSYKAGQFLTLAVPGTNERRSYSISSTSFLGEPLTITVKRLDNGAYSRFLFDACEKGALLYTIGTSGFFTLPDQFEPFSQIAFFAAGSGITPILPMINTILHHHPKVIARLVYSNHSVIDTIFLKELQKLQEQFPDTFLPEWLFSDSKHLRKARLSKELLAQYIQAWLPDDKSRALFYMCGPHHYMQMVSIVLLAEGVPSEHIRKEIFDTTRPVTKEMPPDQDVHRITVRYDGQEYSFDAKFPQTILEAAKQKGIVLPYSCEAGKCGTCAATCVKGRVWMSYNEVLVDRELSLGRVLTCTGYAVGGDVTVEYMKHK
jgi:ferredoxin-NADP reductase